MNECISPIEKLRRNLKNSEQINTQCQDFYNQTLTDAEILDISKTARSNYYCVFNKIPNLIYYIQSFALPSATNRKIQIDMPHTADYFVAGHKTDYEEFSVNFYADENFHTYFSLLHWMRENEKKPNIADTTASMSLIMLNNAKQPIIRVDFRDVLCASLSDLQFENQASDPLTFYATFTSYKYKVTYLDGSNIVIL
jgi:hypothetical protein